MEASSLCSHPEVILVTIAGHQSLSDMTTAVSKDPPLPPSDLPPH